MNSEKTKSKSMTKIIIIAAACLVAIVLLIPMLVDFILVSADVSPLFSKIVSTVHTDDEDYTYTEGHGILYTTIEKKEEWGNGYFSGLKFFFGYKKWDADMEIEINYDKFTKTEDDAEIVSPPGEGNDEEVGDVITDDDTLNMDIVKRLAYGDISPFDFMKKFPMHEEKEPGLYYLQLPNDYALRIEYSGETIELIHLEDLILEQSIDLQEDAIYIDTFLLSRDEG